MASKRESDLNENTKASDEANGINHNVKDDSVDGSSVDKKQFHMYKDEDEEKEEEDVKKGLKKIPASDNSGDDDDDDDDDENNDAYKEIKELIEIENLDESDASNSDSDDDHHNEKKITKGIQLESPDVGIIKTVGDDTSGNMEKTKRQDNKVKNKGFTPILCHFCRQCSSHLCRNCSYYYCAVCLERLHPPLGPFRNHVVVNATQVLSEDIHLCNYHGLPVKIYCQICKEKKCSECANTTCHLHLQNVISRDKVKKEKRRLLNDLESLKQKINEIETQVEWDHDKIETSFLLRRERIRQEFASFHDLLFQKESEILNLLDKEKTDRQQHLKKGLPEKMAALQVEEVKLTDMVTSVVQERAARKSVQKLFDAQKRGQSLLGMVQECYSQLFENRGSIQAKYLMDSPFTLLKVKQDLSASLEYFHQDTDPEVTFKQKILFLNGWIHVTQVPVAAYLTKPSSLPPSTYLSYLVQVLSGKQEIWSCYTTNIKALILHSKTTVVFWIGRRYLLRVTPSIVSHTGENCKTSRNLPPTHMLILNS